jgi:hypothetical protein
MKTLQEPYHLNNSRRKGIAMVEAVFMEPGLMLACTTCIVQKRQFLLNSQSRPLFSILLPSSEQD